MPKKKKEIDSGLNNVIDDLKTRFGDESIQTLGDYKRKDIDVVPTGSVGLDDALGVGGLPRGRVVEMFGPESSGKTTLALHTIAEAQKLDGLCAFVDAEHALDPEYAKRVGVDIKNLLVSQPDTGESALEIVDALVRSGKIDVIVIDSVAALTPKREIEGDIDPNKYVGTQARLMSLALRRLTSIISKTKTIVIFINQIRMQVGVTFGNPETTPGGRALKFYSSVRLDIRRVGHVKKGDEIMGGNVRVKVVKNKVAAPYRSTEFALMYDEGVSQSGELIILGEKIGVVTKSGSSYSFGKEKLGRGFDAARTKLREDKKLKESILKEVKETLKKLRESK